MNEPGYGNYVAWNLECHIALKVWQPMDVRFQGQHGVYRLIPWGQDDVVVMRHDGGDPGDEDR